MSQTTTPPAAAFSSASFSDAEKADIRRFCGYETYGAGASMGFQNWRYYQEYGLLEFRMNNLAPAEFQNVRYRLSVLYPIETALDGMYSTLEVDVAASFTRNASELEDRRRHFDARRTSLCEAVGIPPGPLLRGDSGNTARVRV